MLIERSTELQALERLLASRRGAAVIEAPAGYGKSALLDVVETRAREAGLPVRRAAHGPADRRIPLGMLRALALPGLPVALLIDDAQWADRESLEWLARLVRRDAPALIVLAARPGDALAEIAGIRGVAVLEPGPLSVAGSAELIRRHVPGASAELCERLHAAAAGDPWLVGQLAAGSPVSRIELRRRLGQLGAADRHVARALAILGDGADPHRLAGIAGVAVEALVGVRERLAAGGLSAHELVARGVREEMPADVRARLHRAAASALLRDGEPAAAVAHHLLRCSPGGNRAAVTALREAAAEAPAPAAVTYLERALLERGGDRAAILCELAAAEFHAGLPDPRRRLRQALAERPGDRRARSQLAALEVVDPHDPSVVPVEDEPLRLLARARVATQNDRVPDAERAIARLREMAGDSVPLRAAAAWAAAELALRAGRLAEADAEARKALDAGAARLVAASAAEVLGLALIERGAPAEARGILGTGHPRLALAEGDYETAACAARDRVTRALALAHLGRLDEGAAVADEEVGVARASGAPTALALALHARTVCEPGPARRASLAATALTVFHGPAVLVQAALQVEHGAALVRLGRRVEARNGLRAAFATADAAGARPLAERARRELVASGARPRRAAIEGAAALTPRQRQICELAAAGKSNRAIAHALFLSVKTVETHLARAYGILGVPDRAGMVAALAM